MRTRDQISLITRSLQRHPGRTALTAVGLTVSSAALLLLVAVVLGTQRTAANQFTDLAQLSQIVVSPSSLVGGNGLEPKETVLNRSAMRKIASLPGVKTVVPCQASQFSQIVQIGKYNIFGFFDGIGVENLEELDYSPETGSSEINVGTVVLSQKVLDSFFVMTTGFRPYEAQELVGTRFNLKLTRQSATGKTETKTVRLRIGGVLNDAGGDQTEPVIFMSLDEVEALNRWVTGKRVDHNREGYSHLIVKVGDVAQVKAVVDLLTGMGFTASANLSMTEGIASTYALIQIMLGGSGITALLVAVITIINTMTTSILERTREIGLMKALGASQTDVLRLFLGEAAGIGLLGGACGVLMGGMAGVLIDHFGRTYLISHGAPQSLSVSLPLWLFIGTVLFTALVGGLSSLYPSIKASNLTPIIALKQRR
jgi:putative ABC transport system permease protein